MTEGDEAGPLIFMVAGEPSGDALGGALIEALRERTGDRMRIFGIGGEYMAQHGVSSLVPLSDLAVAGVAEVLPRAPLILQRVRETVRAIREMRPDAVVTIDSSGFSWRIAQRLRRAGERLPLIHYVAPMVWAWRPGRARRMARWYDHLLVLLPFEPPYFEQVGLACTYVGHPVIESGAERGDAARFRATYGITGEELVLTILPGSRGGEGRRLLPIFGAALRQLEAIVGPFRVAVPTVENVADAVGAGGAEWPGHPVVLRAMAASGTVALELALARVPMVIAYRLNRLTQIVLDWVVKVRQVNLVNLILGRTLVPEFLGPACTPQRLAGAVAELVRDEAVRSAHREGYDEAMRRLGAGSLSPSQNAADRILAIIAARRRGEPVS